jgi:hypothetical protein
MRPNACLIDSAGKKEHERDHAHGDGGPEGGGEPNAPPLPPTTLSGEPDGGENKSEAAQGARCDGRDYQGGLDQSKHRLSWMTQALTIKPIQPPS